MAPYPLPPKSTAPSWQSLRWHLFQADCSPEEMFLGIRAEAQAVLDAAAREPPSPDANDEVPSRRSDSATPEELVAESIAGRRHQGRRYSNEFESSPAGLVKEELLMYQRAESRLVEMCSHSGPAADDDAGHTNNKG